MLAVLWLGAIATAAAFVIFYRLMVEIGPAKASLVGYLAPGAALLYGAAIAGESVTLASIGGLVLILGGVAIAARGSRRPPLPAEQPTGELAAL